jgi:DNA-binding protein Fis
MPEPLREAINEAVEKYLERRLESGGPIDVAAMAREMARSIVDMIMEQDDQHQGPLLAETISNLGDEYLQRRGLIPNGRHDH